MANDKYSNLTEYDVACSICRDILIQPVTLPCKHNICLECFKNSIELSNLTCPTCRRRIATFVRKTKDFSNSDLWNAIQSQYPEEVKKKLDGIDTRISDYIQNQEIVRRYSEPGEIKSYFQNELSKEAEEIEIINKKEEELSLLAIKTFKDQEEEEIKKQIQLDEELAKSLISQDKIEETRKGIQLNKGVAKSSLLTSSRVTRSSKRKSTVQQKVVTSTPKRKIINYFRSTSQSPSLHNLSTSFNSSISETAISPSTSTVNFFEDSHSNVTEISLNSINNTTTVENDQNNLDSTEFVKLQMDEFERAKRLAEQLKEDELLAKSLMEEENKLNRKRIFSRDYPLRPTTKRQKTGKKLEIKRGKKLGKDSVVIKGQHIICKDASGNISFNNPV